MQTTSANACLSRRALVLGAACAPLACRAQANTVINLVVPLAPGGIADITARPFAIPLARELGQPVVVENRIGAGGAVGMAHVARQQPDGQTLLMALSSIVVIPESDKVSGRAPRYTSFTGGKSPIWSSYGHERMGWALSVFSPTTP